MIRETLQTIDLLQGGFSLIFVIINTVIGIIIISRYFQYRKSELLLVGIAWTGLAMPWVPDGINFLMILILDIKLPTSIYFILAVGTLPFSITIWVIVILDLIAVSKNRAMIIKGVYVVLCTIYEIFFFVFLFYDMDQLGTEITPFRIEYEIFSVIMLMGCVITLLITGLLFARESLKSEDSMIKLKGKLLILAFILFNLGAVLDSLGSLLNEVMVVTIRLILVSSAIFFYTGYILPEWVKKLFLRK